MDLHGKVYQKGDNPPTTLLSSLRFRIESNSENLTVPDKSYSLDNKGYIALGSYDFYSEGTYELTITQNCIYNEKYMEDKEAVHVIIKVSLDEVTNQLTANIDYIKNNKKGNEIYFDNTYENNQDVVVELNNTKDSINPGDINTETIKISNPTNTPMYGIYIRKYIPKDCIFESVSGTGGSYGTINGEEHATWFIPILNPKENLTLSLKYKVNICVSQNNNLKTKVLYEVTNSTDIIYTNDPIDPR